VLNVDLSHNFVEYIDLNWFQIWRHVSIVLETTWRPWLARQSENG